MAEELRRARSPNPPIRERKRATQTQAPESSILDRAIQVIGDKNEALRWMGTPVRALEYATPVSLLGTRKGRQAVEAVLGRLEHGVLWLDASGYRQTGTPAIVAPAPR